MPNPRRIAPPARSSARSGPSWTSSRTSEPSATTYYARVIGITTPGWIAYDVFRFGIEIPKDVKNVHQERAYTSPIWNAECGPCL